MRQWHYIVDGQQQGPVEEVELVRMFSEGQLPAETMVCRTNYLPYGRGVDMVRNTFEHSGEKSNTESV